MKTHTQTRSSNLKNKGAAAKQKKQFAAQLLKAKAKNRTALTIPYKKQSEPSKLKKWAIRNMVTLNKIVILVFAIFAIFSIWYNPFLLFLIPAIGMIVFFRNDLNFLYWLLKVYVLKREFYSDRRRLYKQGTLFHHLSNKKPKIFNKSGCTVVIWQRSLRIQLSVFNDLVANKEISNKEHI
ncbi:hypothetical protein [Cochleicola gelatinilyticus]|uniref:Uncharacterized protein n=1 Tax=Cochleicola gelatinilyticus TaxID=1763537 RepID=A0A167IK69_9FLAO|nr:hypothetical protein [Cochleicola gelatinilyticus]OAB79738.1 hypothetical protein ULVI_03055 [Cochleicola gelatinilyticus]